jgi:hypothetical protein
MSSLDRAKRFLAAKAVKLALTALPLAALTNVVAPSVQAGSFSASAGCTVIAGSGSCAQGQIQGTGGDANFNWVALDTPSNVSSDGNGVVDLRSVGSVVSGGVYAGEIIPVSYDFFVKSVPIGGGSGGYSSGTANAYLTFNVYGSGDPGNTYSTSPSPIEINNIAYGTEVTGTSDITITQADTLTSFEIDLAVDGNNSQFTVYVPGPFGNAPAPAPAPATLDLNDVPTATPEPASLTLTASGLLGALLLKRRKRA